MGREGWQDLSVQISRRRQRFVLDPFLCLTRHGVALIRRLAPHAELWLPPAFLGILDGWEYYYEQPEHLVRSVSMQKHGGAYSHDEFREALHAWLRLREELGHGRGQLFWLGDNLHESALPPDVDASLLQHWEHLAQGLDQRLPEPFHGGPVAAAFPDTLALVAALDHARLLTVREPHGPTNLPKARGLCPTLCHNLEPWRLPSVRLKVEDDFVQYERTLLVRLFVEAGVAGFLWSGAPLAVAHVFAPGFVGGEGEPDLLRESEPHPVKEVWEGARLFWYFLFVEDEDGLR